jgi:hypothetical protein
MQAKTYESKSKQSNNNKIIIRTIACISVAAITIINIDLHIYIWVRTVTSDWDLKPRPKKSAQNAVFYGFSESYIPKESPHYKEFRYVSCLLKHLTILEIYSFRNPRIVGVSRGLATNDNWIFMECVIIKLVFWMIANCLTLKSPQSIYVRDKLVVFRSLGILT